EPRGKFLPLGVYVIKNLHALLVSLGLADGFRIGLYGVLVYLKQRLILLCRRAGLVLRLPCGCRQCQRQDQETTCVVMHGMLSQSGNTRQDTEAIDVSLILCAGPAGGRKLGDCTSGLNLPHRLLRPAAGSFS